MRLKRTFTTISWLVAVCLIGWGLLSIANDGVVASFFDSQVDPAEKLERLKSVFNSFGAFAPLVYIAFVMLEVVIAPLPGAMLYAPGGIIFGWFWGGLFSLIGNVLGAGIACQLMRSVLGAKAAEFFDDRDLRTHEEAIAKRGLLVVLLLRLNPLTSSDIVSYAAGLTTIPVWKVMVGTLLGMAPLCWVQAWLADELLSAYPRLLVPLLIACGIYAVVFGWILWRLMTRRPSADHAAGMKDNN